VPSPSSEVSRPSGGMSREPGLTPGQGLDLSPPESLPTGIILGSCELRGEDNSLNIN